MDAESIFKLIDAGGALGSLVVFAVYLVYQNRALSIRNNELVDRSHKSELRHVEALQGVQRAVERIGDKLSA